MYRILIVDDEDSVRRWLRELLSKYGYEVFEVSNGAKALEVAKNQDIDLVLLDVVMPGTDGMKTLLDLKRNDHEMPVIMVTALADIATAVQATKKGAFDFITKPIEADRLMETIQAGLERLESQSSLRQLRENLEWTFGPSQIMGRVIEQIRRAARGNGKLVIQGEAGTGKSIVARTIHNLSKKAATPFRSILLSRIPEDCLEDILMEANTQRVPCTMRGGTVFFDGMHDVSIAVQHRLAEIIQLGTTNDIDSDSGPFRDVRIVCATGMDLKTLEKEGRLTGELRRCFEGQIIMLPSLKEHKDDVFFLASKYLWKIADEMKHPVKTLHEDATSLLVDYSWPGNVRELEYVIRRVAVSFDENIIRAAHLKSVLTFSGKKQFYPLPEVQNEITEAKYEAPETKKFDEQCYRQIVEQSPMGIFICRDGRIQYANHKLAEIIKANSAGELEGIHAIDIIDSHSREVFKASLEGVLRGGRQISQSEVQIRYNGGAAVDTKSSVFACMFEGRTAVTVVVEDVTRLRAAEEELTQKENDSRQKAIALRDANAALNILMERKADESEEVKSALLTNVRELVLPYLQRVRNGHLSDSQLAYLDIIESNLNHITAPFVQNMKNVYGQLTPTEIQVADMIKNGRTTKEIAELLNVCSGTVEGHRVSIRKKLGLNSKSINLRSYLASL